MASIHDVAPVCFNYMSQASIWTFSATCKELHKYVPYVHTPVHTVERCVACNNKVTDSTCCYHPGVMKHWSMSGKPSKSNRANNVQSHKNLIYTCCGKAGKGCVTKSRHITTEMSRCRLCGSIFNSTATTSSHIKCRYHPADGADIHGKWYCCQNSNISALGCQEQDNHTAPTKQTVKSVVWSRLGTKAVIQTKSTCVNVFSYSKGTKVWVQKYCFVGARVALGGKVEQSYPTSNRDCAFSPNGCSLLLFQASTLYLYDLRRAASQTIATGNDIYGYSWGNDGRYVFYFVSSNYFDDSRPITFNAYDTRTRTLLPFVRFTYSNASQLHADYIVPNNTLPNFMQQEVRDFFEKWIERGSGIQFDTYGNRFLYWSSNNIGVLYEFTVEDGAIRLTMLGVRPSIFPRGGLGVYSISWHENGFKALIELVEPTRHTYELREFDNKLQTVASKKLTDAIYESPYNYIPDKVTLFRCSYSAHRSYYYYAQQSNFYVLDQNLKVLHSFTWTKLDEKESASTTYFHPNAGIAIYSEGVITRLTIHVRKGEQPKHSSSRFIDERILAALCTVVSSISNTK